MENSMASSLNFNPYGRSLYNDPTLRSIPSFVATHMNGAQRGFSNYHMTRTHLQPFLNMKYGDTYRIYINYRSPYGRNMPEFSNPYVDAVFVHFVYRNGVPNAKMFVVGTNIPTGAVRLNELHIFDIRNDFRQDFVEPQNISTDDTREQFKQMRMNSSGAVNQIVMNAIDRQRTANYETALLQAQPRVFVPTTYFPRYQGRLQHFGGKKSKKNNSKTKRKR
jgi:hypothetical protein